MDCLGQSARLSGQFGHGAAHFGVVVADDEPYANVLAEGEDARLAVQCPPLRPAFGRGAVPDSRRPVGICVDDSVLYRAFSHCPQG